MSNMEIGYISRRYNADGVPTFKFIHGTYTRVINQRGDSVRCKFLRGFLDYEDVLSNTTMIRDTDIILVCEPFFLDEFIKQKVERWIEYANHADPSEYDPFYRKEKE